jgi:hypothetical protein
MLDLLCQRAIGQVLLRKPNGLPHSSPPRIRPACTQPSKIKLEHLVQLIILQFRQSPKPLPRLRPRIQPRLPEHLAPTPRQHLLPARRLPARPASPSFIQPLPLPRLHARPLRGHNPYPNTPNATHQLKPEHHDLRPPRPLNLQPTLPPPLHRKRHCHPPQPSVDNAPRFPIRDLHRPPLRDAGSRLPILGKTRNQARAPLRRPGHPQARGRRAG